MLLPHICTVLIRSLRGYFCENEVLKHILVIQVWEEVQCIRWSRWRLPFFLLSVYELDTLLRQPERSFDCSRTSLHRSEAEFSSVWMRNGPFILMPFLQTLKALLHCITEEWINIILCVFRDRLEGWISPRGSPFVRVWIWCYYWCRWPQEHIRR